MSRRNHSSGRERIHDSRSSDRTDYSGRTYSDGSDERSHSEDSSCGSSQSHDDDQSLHGLLKRCKREGAVDRISALPDSVLIHILSFLRMEDAVGTDVLSKRWQYLWTHVPTLHFRFPESLTYRDEAIRGFVEFVDKTLILCGCSKINKFVIHFRYESRFASRVNQWNRFAARNNAEEIHLIFDEAARSFGPDNRYVLPQHLYTNSSVRLMHFSSCNVTPSGVVSWESLKSLSIGFVKLSEELIQKILSGSPVLEFLELYYFCGINRLEITNASVKKLIIRDYWGTIMEEGGDPGEEDDSMLDILAPNLQSLEIAGSLRRKKCRLVDVSSLVDATLNFYLMRYPGDSNNDYGRSRNILTELLVNLRHVKNLTIGTWGIQALSILEVKGLRSPLSKRKCLTLAMCIKKEDLPGIASLLESSPRLETLIIEMDTPDYSLGVLSKLCNFDEDNYWTLQKRNFKCLMLTLKTVKIAGFVGSYPKYEFSFVQFLLKNGMVLEKIVINGPREGRNTSKILFQAAQKFLSFPRSSPHAVVVLNE